MFRDSCNKSKIIRINEVEQYHLLENLQNFQWKRSKNEKLHESHT